MRVMENEGTMELATFGAGCFWGVEEAFRTLPGVAKTTVGYLGGTLVNPTYKDVCTGRTGHAEVVQIEFNPQVIPYEALVARFFSIHDPTTKNRQGPDIGEQYRSAIFYHSEAQKAAAEKIKAEEDASGKFRGPIVTEITPTSAFYAAEDYHQQYLLKRGLSSCHI